MKKSICMLLASVLLVFALTACQGSEKSSTFETLNVTLDGEKTLSMEMNQEMQKEEKDEKKLQALNEELQKIYTDVMGNPNMMEYNIAKQEMDEMMQKVNAILMMCVNGEDPDTCEIPDHNCTGSCATCGGCH